MESRWYLPYGRTLKDTKIEDRGHALHIARPNWKQITNHLERNISVSDAIAAEEAKKLAIKHASHEMSKHWDNSSENIRKRKDEERTLRIEAKEDTNYKNFLKIRKEQAEEREIYCEQVRQQMFVISGRSKDINSAILQSEVLYEREKQLELKEKIKEHEKEQEKMYYERVKQGVLEEKIEKKEAAEKAHDKKVQLNQYYQEQIKSNENLSKNAKAIRYEAELIENMKAEVEQKEMEKHAKAEAKIAFTEYRNLIDLSNPFEIPELQFNKNYRLNQQLVLGLINELEEFAEMPIRSNRIPFHLQLIEKRANAKKEFDTIFAEQKEYRAFLAKESEEIEEVIDIFSRSKIRMDCIRKRKEREAIALKATATEELSKLAKAEFDAKLAEEERILNNAQQELEAKEDEKEKAKVAKAHRLKLERIAEHKAVLERMEKEKKHKEEVKKWEMLNRFKAEENIKIEENKSKQKIIEEGQKRKKFLTQQTDNNNMEELEQAERDEECRLNLEVNRIEDEKFFKYGKIALDNAKKNGRNTYPIEKVIMDYKKQVLNILPESHKCEDLKSCHAKGNIINTTPGQMAHTPKSDPGYKKNCKCNQERLYR